MADSTVRDEALTPRLVASAFTTAAELRTLSRAAWPAAAEPSCVKDTVAVVVVTIGVVTETELPSAAVSDDCSADCSPDVSVSSASPDSGVITISKVTM